MPFRVTIDRDECIRCGNCWADCPEFFSENDEDGFSEVMGPYRLGDDRGLGEAPDALEGCVKEAEEDCPVVVIHVEEV